VTVASAPREPDVPTSTPVSAPARDGGLAGFAAGSSTLAGPAWLAELRARGLSALATVAVPSEAEEQWRYSRIDELDLDAFAPVLEPPRKDLPLSAEARVFLEAVGARSALVRSVGGFVVEVAVASGASDLGVRVETARELPAQPDELDAHLARRADALTVLAGALCPDVVVVRVPAGVVLSEPIVVVHEVGEDAEGAAIFPRALVVLGPGAQASVVEMFVSGDERCVVVPLLEVELGDGAHLQHTSVQQLGRRAWHLGYQASHVGRDAVLHSFLAALGGEYSRQLTSTVLAGVGGASELLAVYLGDGTQVQDMRTFQEHEAPRTRSELVFKGAVADTARSVYTGLIHMHPGAKRADASQTNRNLVLSEGAHADSVPNLDIEENDVRCSHASAVGPIDPDQLFYLATRGVPPEVAERLILLGFFDDLLDRAPVSGVAPYLRAAVARRLSAGVLATGSRAVGSREVPA